MTEVALPERRGRPPGSKNKVHAANGGTDASAIAS